MGKGKIETNKMAIKEVFNNCWFEIPNYQRQYVWGVDNVDKLLEDIKDHCERNKNKGENEDKEEYFLGSLVLLKKTSPDIKEFQVLDGQQRLTTLLLLLCVIRDLSNDDKAYKRHKYIKEESNPDEGINDEKERITFKIRDANGDFKKFCNEYIFDFIKDRESREGKYKKISDYKNSNNISIKNMSNALERIKEFLCELKKSDETILDKYVQTLLNDVILIYVSAENFDDAFRMFTTLNSSGVPLSHSDILKSINLGAIDKKVQDKNAKTWEEIESSFKNPNEFNVFLLYLRDILIRNKAQKSLLKEFTEIIYEKELLKKGIDTINFIEEYHKIYEKIILLIGLEKEYFDSHDNELNNYRNLINILKCAFPSNDWIPPLLMYFKKFKYEGLLKFLKKLEANAISDVICRESATKRKQKFFKIMKLIHDSDKPSDVLVSNNDCLANSNKEKAKKIIEEGATYDKKYYAKYILLKYEYLNQDNSTSISDYSNLQIEHVLPRNPSKDSDWLKIFNEDERTKWTDNIANLILINGRKNNQLGNLDFSKKKEKLKEKDKIKDIFKGSQEMLAEDEWKPDTLEKRNKKMCEKLFGD